MVNLDKSPDGGRVYVNLAASPRDLVAEEQPLEHYLHLRTRLESLVPDRPRVEEALDLEQQGLSQSDREGRIANALTQYALPFLDEASTLEGIRLIIQGHPSAKRFAVRVELTRLLADLRGGS